MMGVKSMAHNTATPSFTQKIADVRSQQGESLDELSRRSAVLVVFLRHAGCTFCREALADLKRQRPEIEAHGCTLVIVHLSDDRSMAALMSKYQLDDVPRFADPEKKLYQAFELKRGTLWQLLGPNVWWPGAKAFFAGHGLGMIDGDGFQMPGAFVLHHGQIIKAFRHASPADRPNYVELSDTCSITN
jgi:peroxiredoxin